MTLNRISLHDSVRMAPADLVGGTELVEPLSSSTANAVQPSLTILADGGHVLVWEEQDGYANALKWQRFDSDGNSVSPVATLGGGGTYSPSVTAMADGGFAIAYATYSGIEVQRFDAASVATGTPIQADYPGNYDASPTISGLPDGGFLMTWTGYHMDPSDPWNDGIAIRRFDANGLPLGEPQQVNTESYGNQGAMSVAVLADGGYVVTWRTQTQDVNWSYGVAMRHYDASGQPTGPEVAVSPTLYGEFDPSVTALADGGWVVTWSSDKNDMQDIYGQVYNSDGTLRGNEIHLANAGYQFAPTVTGLENGGFIIAWGSGEIVAQRFDADGAAFGDQFVVNEILAGEQSSPVLAARPDGGFVVAWQTDGTITYDPMQPWNHNPTGGAISQRVFAPNAPTILQVNEDAATSATFDSVTENVTPGLTYALLTQPSAGLVVDNGDGTFTFDATGQFDYLAQGDKEIVTFTYRVTDAAGEWSDRTATVEVIGANDGPVAQAVNGAVIEGQANSFAFGTADADRGAVLSYTMLTPPAQGAVTVNGDGTFSYVAEASMAEGETQTVSFAYRVTDEHGASADSTATLTVTGSNDDPVAAADTVEGTGASPLVIALADLLANDTDAEGDTLSITSVQDAVNGAVSLDGAGNVVFTPETGATGPQSFTYTVTDGHGGFATQTVEVHQPLVTGGPALVAMAETTEALGEATANAAGPSITVLSDGSSVMVWEERDGTGNNAIKWQRFGHDGTPAGQPSLLSTASIYSPSVTALANGGFAIAYGDFNGIQVQRFDAGSNAMGTAIQADYLGHYDANASITGLPDGGFLVTWVGYQMDPSDPWNDNIAIRRFDAAGLPVGEPQKVNTDSYGNQSGSAVTVLADGGWVVTWLTQTANDYTYGVSQRRYDASGQPIGAEAPVGATPFQQEFNPAVAALADGGWVVSWSSDKDDGQDIYAQLYNSDGSLRGDEIHLANPGYQFAPAISALDDGGFVIAWGDGDIVGQRFDAQGATVGALFTLNEGRDGEQNAPVMAARPDGGFVVAWQTDGSMDWTTYTTVGGTVSQRVFSGHDIASATGGNGDDLLLGSSASDNLTGGGGSDTYLAGGGSGADTVFNQNAAADGDRVQFAGGIDRTQLWFQQQSQDLKVSVIGTTDSVTIKDWFVAEANHVDRFQTADGGTLAHSQVLNLVTAMSSFAPPPLGQTQLTAEELQQLQPVIAANWQ